MPILDLWIFRLESVFRPMLKAKSHSLQELYGVT